MTHHGRPNPAMTDLNPHHTDVPTTLAGLAALCAAHMREHFPTDTEQTRQVLALAEEAGEFVGAYRRWAGLARRRGGWDDVTAELADIVITAYVTAHVLNIDLDAAWQTKAAVVLTRGWRDTAPPAQPAAGDPHV